MTEVLAGRVMDTLLQRGPRSSSGVAVGLGCEVAAVEAALIAHPGLFEAVGGLSPGWALRGPESFSEFLGLGRVLHRWQARALQSWFVRDRVGMVSAVTGTGKTEVGLAAIADARRRGLPSMIVVPSVDLLQQWKTVLEGAFPDAEVGTAAPGSAADARSNLVVAQASAIRADVPIAIGPRALVVVDEVQRLSATEVSHVTSVAGAFSERLGLTSSIRWSENPGRLAVPPMLGDEIVACTYRQAVEDEVLAPATVITVGVGFTGSERHDYSAVNQHVMAAESKLRDAGVDLSRGIRVTVQELASNAGYGQASIYAKEYIRAERRRRQILGSCEGKFAVLRRLFGPMVDIPRTRTLVFSSDDGAAAGAERSAHSAGLTAETLRVNQSSVTPIGKFEEFALQVLTVSRSSAGEIELPVADVGIILAPAQDDDEMRSRLGRVVGSVNRRRPSLVILVYVNGTVEDPAISDIAGLMPLKAASSTLVDADADIATVMISEWGGKVRDERPGGETGIVVDQDSLVTEPGGWSIRDAILDVCDEYGGIPLWNELREVLPDMAAEEALQAGMEEFNWMRIGSQLVGAGGVRTTRNERVEALACLDDAVNKFGRELVTVDEISSFLGESALLGGLSIGRVRAIWSQLGGRFRSVFAPVESGDVRIGSHGDGARPTPPSGDSPMLSALRAAIVARGGKVIQDGGQLAITGRDGIRRTASVASAQDSGSETRFGVRILVDMRNSSPDFYLFDSSRDGRDEDTNELTAPQWSAARNAWQKLRLDMGVKLKSAPSNVATGGSRRGGDDGETTGQSGVRRSVGRSEGEKTEISVAAAGGSDGDKVPLRLAGVSAEVLAAFDPNSGKVTITEFSGHERLVGTSFRNSAVAAATVRSMIAGRTVFGVGYEDWLVVGRDVARLGDYIAESGMYPGLGNVFAGGGL